MAKCSKSGLVSLRWLLEAQTAEAGHFAPIGCHGFWTQGGERARFDQQPLEAHAMVSACLEAFGVTRDDFWHRAARRCFEWFLGRNDLGQPLYDPTTGGCRDALLQDHLNQNQGAESSLAFYLSLTPNSPAPAAFNAVIPQIMRSLNHSAHRRHLAAEQRARADPPLHPVRSARIVNIIGRALALSEAEIEEQLAAVTAEFGSRHLDLRSFWRRHFEQREGARLQRSPLLRSAAALYRRALFRRIRPGIRRALQSLDRRRIPDQTGLAEGELRFILQPARHGGGAHLLH